MTIGAPEDPALPAVLCIFLLFLLLETYVCPFGLLIAVSKSLSLVWVKAHLPLLTAFVHQGMAEGVNVEAQFCNVLYSHQAALNFNKSFADLCWSDVCRLIALIGHQAPGMLVIKNKKHYD